MTETLASSEYTKQLHARMRAAREQAGYTQADMARLLGITRHAYEKYETRSRLPHHLLGQFTLATRVSVAWLLGAPENTRGPRQIKYPDLGLA